jgi:hypothetical protein
LTGADSVAPFGGAAFHDVRVWGGQTSWAPPKGLRQRPRRRRSASRWVARTRFAPDDPARTPDLTTDVGPPSCRLTRHTPSPARIAGNAGRATSTSLPRAVILSTIEHRRCRTEPRRRGVNRGIARSNPETARDIARDRKRPKPTLSQVAGPTEVAGSRAPRILACNSTISSQSRGSGRRGGCRGH